MDKISVESVSAFLNCKATRASLIGLITLYLLKKLRDRSHDNKIVAGLLAKIEVAQKEKEESLAWARNQTKFVSDDEREKIARMDFRQLREALQSGSISAENTIRVYYGLALKSHDKTNCLVGIIKDSLEAARSLDEKARNPSYVKPPLFGMPISIKESIEMAGSRCSWGVSSQLDHIPKEDSYPVMRLRECGMIPFCQTNIPTSCMAYNCSNSIYGTTTNPFDSSRAPGGSSGGEGALISTLGSLIGIGSDLGGSIRIPAAFSGCCGFKPSSTRFSLHQLKEPIPMRPFLSPTEGPLAQDPHAIALALRCIWSDHFLSNRDPLSVPVDFREDLFQEGRKYRIGFWTSDGYLPALPGNQRAVREAADTLRAKGHEVVPFSLGGMAREITLGIFSTVYSEGGARQSHVLKHEPLSPMMAPIRDAGLMPFWQRKLLAWVTYLMGDTVTSDFFFAQPKTTVDLQTGVDRLFSVRKQLIQKMKEEGIDCLLCPATLCPAMPHALGNQIPFTAILPTLMWNAMDFPAGVVTTNKWNGEDEKALESYPESGMIEKGIKKGCKKSIGLPLAVQLVAPAFRDEIVLRVMADLYDGVHH